MKFIVERGKIMQQIQEELSHVWKGWTIEELIGEGSFGKVYRIVREEFGHTYEAALKVITIPQNQSEVKSVLNEGIEDYSYMKDGKEIKGSQYKVKLEFPKKKK